jgi:FtsZ-binding cell division protein ZapB
MSNNLKTIIFNGKKYTMNYSNSFDNFINQINKKFKNFKIEKYIVNLDGYEKIEIDSENINNLENYLNLPLFSSLELLPLEDEKMINNLIKEIKKLKSKNNSLEYEIKNIKNEYNNLKNEFEHFKKINSEEISKLYKLIEENADNTITKSQQININESSIESENISSNYNNNYNILNDNNYIDSQSTFYSLLGEITCLTNLSVSLKEIESKKKSFIACQMRFKNCGQLTLKQIKLFCVKENNSPFYIEEKKLNDGNEIENNQVIKFELIININSNYQFKEDTYSLTLKINYENEELKNLKGNIINVKVSN